jgi:DsbC/DsbD-like thiol-disulfide interchange protein
MAVLSSASAWAAGPPHHVQADLVADTESIRPGQPFHVGLRLRMDPGWHTYWKNPGDSGLATRLTWKLPEGFTAAAIEWPFPKRFVQGPVTSYGYDGEVLLPVAITPPSSFVPGASIALSARADWLECSEACIPGRRELSLELPVRAEAPRPSTAAAAFSATRERLPRPAEGWSISAEDDRDRYVLVLQPPRTAEPFREAYFFPDASQVIDHAAPQTLARSAARYRLELTPAANAAHPADGLAGVLVTDGPGGQKAIRIDARWGVGGHHGGGRPPPPPKENQ